MTKSPGKPAKSASPAVMTKGSRLADFEPLLPVEEKLRQCAAAGEECVVDDFSGERPKKATKLNTIRADFLRYMILGGCEDAPVSPRGLQLCGAMVVADDEKAVLDLAASNIPANLKLACCHIEPEIDLTHTASMNVSLEGTHVTSLTAQSWVVEGSVLLRGGFASEKPVRLNGAQISGKLICQGGQFLAPDQSIIANRAKIGGDVDLGNIIAKGTIALTGSEIGGDFMPQGAVLEGTPALQLRNSKIGGTLHWRGLGFVDGEVDLSGASCKTLNTGNTSWLRKRPKYRDRDPAKEEGEEPKQASEYHTKLDNFTYEGFSNLPDNVESSYWIEWLKQQPEDHLGKKFKPRPWEQLAGVLESMGYEEEARDVRIEKQRLLTGFMIAHEEPRFTLTYVWHWLQVMFRKFLWGPVVSYGYRPGNALLWLFGFILLGTFIYDQAARKGIITPTHPLIFKEAVNGFIPSICAENWVYFGNIPGIDEKGIAACKANVPSEYSEFQSFIYAADVALPVVNLRMESDWAPRVVFTNGKPDRFGWWVRTFEWFLITTGWILSLLFVSAVGSSIRR